MTIVRKLAVMVAGTLALTGALAQSPDTPGAAPPTGIVHIYRLPQSVGGATHPTVSCDTYPVARLQNGRVYTLNVPPGTHTFTTVDGPTGVNVRVEPGKEYFVRIDYPVNSHLALHAFAVLVPPDEGAGEIKKLKPLDKWYIETSSCSTK